MSAWVVFANVTSHLLLLWIITQPKALTLINSESEKLKNSICTCTSLKHLFFF